MEREHDSQHRMTEEEIHWLQDKNRIFIEVNGIHLRDYFMMKKVFWTAMISLQQTSFHVTSGFWTQECKTDSVQKLYQNDEERTTQFRPVAYLDGITGQDGKFINWSDMLNADWDSLELHEAGVVSDGFVIGHWDNLSVSKNKFSRRLVPFLKTTFMDEMDHNHLNNIMLQKETMVSWFVDIKLMTKILISFLVWFLSIWIKMIMMHQLE